MSEILKIINEKSAEEIKNSINSEIDNIEDKIKITNSLKYLIEIDSLIPKYNIDLSYNKNNWKFYFLSWENTLKIPLNSDEILNFWKELASVLNNDKTLWITWKRDFRRIYEVPLFWWISRWKQLIYRWTEFNWNNLDLSIAEQNNRFVEEIYKFTQNIKWIPENKWKTESWMRQWQEMWN